jgi:hypothetical protein
MQADSFLITASVFSSILIGVALMSVITTGVLQLSPN